MKGILILIIIIFPNLASLAQKVDVFKDFEFDSSYSIIGIGRGFQGKTDSLSRFWFVLDNPDDMNALKREWTFKRESIRGIEFNSFDIFITRNKQRVQGGALIFPVQGVINVHDVWYKFDTSRLSRLHEAHPLKYHTEIRRYNTFLQYVADGNSVLRDSLLLFFFEPSLTYEGKFTITDKKPYLSPAENYVQADIIRQLRKLAPEGSFRAVLDLKDSVNISSPDKVRITVECAKSLHDNYKNRHVEIGDWKPTEIEMKIFWRD